MLLQIVAHRVSPQGKEGHGPILKDAVLAGSNKLANDDCAPSGLGPGLVTRMGHTLSQGHSHSPECSR